VSPGADSPGWAVVTGASSGIGGAFARELARRRYRVLAIARRRDRLEALARDKGTQQGLVEPLTADRRTAVSRNSDPSTSW
jgi:short-subunit dehydrogenase